MKDYAMTHPSCRYLPRTPAVLLAALAVCATMFAAPVRAADYPDRPITVIAPFPPGGGVDFMLRLVSEELGKELKTTLIIDNRGGAGGNIGLAAGARAAPNGYTLTGLSTSAVVNPVLMKAATVIPSRDYAAVGGISAFYLAWYVKSDSPIRTMGELLTQARAKREDVTFASLGGTIEMAKLMAETMGDVKFRTINYKGTPDLVRSVIAGETMVSAIPLGILMPFVKDGRVRVIGYTANKRTPQLPDAPTVAEALPGYAVGSWLGLVAPVGTPQDVLRTVNVALNKVLRRPEIAQKMADSGNEALTGSPEDFGKFVADESKRYSDLGKKAGIVPE